MNHELVMKDRYPKSRLNHVLDRPACLPFDVIVWDKQDVVRLHHHIESFVLKHIFQVDWNR